MKIRALVVDDEPLARRHIRRLAITDDALEIASECGDGASAVRLIRETIPDLVFLDIQMPEMDGFEVLRTIGAHQMPVTIFVTAFDRFALQAFDTNAVDYLLKPVGKERFHRALARAKQRIAGKVQRDEMHRALSSLERVVAMQKTQKYLDRLPVPGSGRIQFVATKDIDWIGAEGNYVRLHAGNLEYEFRETLTDLETKLNPAEFLRIHRSTIVNVRRIREVQTWFHGYHRVVLDNGKELRMSRYQREIARKLALIR